MTNPAPVGSFQSFPARRGLRYLGLPGVTLFLGGAAILILSSPFHHVEEQWKTMGKMVIVMIMGLIVSFWTVFLSGLPRRGTALILIFLASLGVATLTVDYDGDLNPSFRFRSWVMRLLSQSRDDDLTRHRQWQKENLPEVNVDLTPRATDFPGYRGADRTGVVQNAKISRDWNAHPPKELWKQPTGEGYGSFAVVNDFLFTIEQRRDLSANRDEEAVVCYHAPTGKEIWAHTWPGRFDETLGGAGPRTTPTVVDGDVYALGALGRLVCLEGKTGHLKWGVETLTGGRSNLHWGMSGSPLVFQNRVVVNPGPPGALAAYDRHTGALLWAEGTQQAGYSSPMLATLAGVEQILLFDGRGLAGCDVQTGKEMWRLAWKTQGNEGINVAQPIVVGKDQVFIASAYGRGGAMLRIGPDEAGKWAAEALWDTGRTAMRCKMSSPVWYDGFIYGLDDGRLQCIDGESGKVMWTDDRPARKETGSYDHGQILLCGDLLVILTQFGEAALVEATPSAFRELGRKPFLEGKKTWNNPAFSNGVLYIRNHLQMAAIDLRGE